MGAPAQPWPPAPQWSTACFGHGADSSPLEMLTLGEHLHSCRLRWRPWPALQRAGQALHRVAAGRFMSTLSLGLLLGGSLLLWPW